MMVPWLPCERMVHHVIPVVAKVHFRYYFKVVKSTFWQKFVLEVRDALQSAPAPWLSKTFAHISSNFISGRRMYFSYFLDLQLESVLNWSLVKRLLRHFPLGNHSDPTRLCHVVYYHGDKKYPCLVGIGLRLDHLSF